MKGKLKLPKFYPCRLIGYDNKTGHKNAKCTN